MSDEHPQKDAIDYQHARNNVDVKGLLKEFKHIDSIEDTIAKSRIAGVPTTPEDEPGIIEKQKLKRKKLIEKLEEQIEALETLGKHNCRENYTVESKCAICGRDGRA